MTYGRAATLGDVEKPVDSGHIWRVLIVVALLVVLVLVLFLVPLPIENYGCGNSCPVPHSMPLYFPGLFINR